MSNKQPTDRAEPLIDTYGHRNVPDAARFRVGIVGADRKAAQEAQDARRNAVPGDTIVGRLTFPAPFSSSGAAP